LGASVTSSSTASTFSATPHLERQHGPRRGVKHYIRVVRLLAEHSLSELLTLC
jgi:hypothetical protein